MLTCRLAKPGDALTSGGDAGACFLTEGDPMPDATETPAIRAPRGRDLTCKGWHQEAALRMLMNNLDPQVAERPEDLVVYGGAGQAPREWENVWGRVRTLRGLEDQETFLGP